ncbi:MAG: pimeloyl-ACP methyl ester carboxylesterase [Polyangiales bacterium]
MGSAIVTGFSQGALLAWTTGLRHPDVVGLVIPMAGWVPPQARPQPLRGVVGPRQRSIHGAADPIVRIGPTRDLVQELRGAGYDVEWIEEEGVAHVVSPEMNRLFETWLEEGLRERAPQLQGGLGIVGEDPEAVEPYESAIEVDTEEPVLAPLPEETDALDEDVEPAPNSETIVEISEPAEDSNGI